MKIKLLVTAAATVMASTAMAQSAFEGAYGQIGIGYETISPSLSTSVSAGGVGIPAGISTSNANSFAGTVTVGYNFAINKDFLLGVGAEYSPIAGSSQNVHFTIAGLNANNPVGTYKKNNSYNFFVSPGVVVGNDGLAYAKKRNKMEKKAGLENWKQYMVNGQKLKYVGWIDAYKFYDEKNQYVEFEKLPEGITPVETEEVNN